MIDSRHSPLRSVPAMATARQLSLLLVVLLAACATGIAPGALSPIGARVTNETLEADQHTLDAWSRRVAALSTTSGSAPERAYLAARATAWLGLARDAYAADPRDGAADRALLETRRIVAALESNQSLPIERTSSRPAGPRADLWSTLDSLRTNGAALSAPVAMADAEVALVRAAQLAAWRPTAGTPTLRAAANAQRECDIERQVARAEQLMNGVRGSMTRIAGSIPVGPRPAAATPNRDSAFTVELSGTPMGPAMDVAPVKMAAPVVAARPVGDALPPMRLLVHFAPRSSVITAESRVALDELIVGLRAHRSAELAVESFTPTRVGERPDRGLATRRTAAVRRYLSDARLDLSRVTITTARAGREMSGGDTRMMLTLIGVDGRMLTLAGRREDAATVDLPHDSQDAPLPAQIKTVVPDRSPNFPW